MKSESKDKLDDTRDNVKGVRTSPHTQESEKLGIFKGKPKLRHNAKCRSRKCPREIRVVKIHLKQNKERSDATNDRL